MLRASLLVWFCLMANAAGAEPKTTPRAKEANEIRGVVLEMFADSLLLVSAGEDDLAQYGDGFSIGFDPKNVFKSGATAKIVSLGKRLSVARIDSPATIRISVGDQLHSTDWQRQQEQLESKRFMEVMSIWDLHRGGAILINGK
jgi:hypothetical protein